MASPNTSPSVNPAQVQALVANTTPGRYRFARGCRTGVRVFAEGQIAFVLINPETSAGWGTDPSTTVFDVRIASGAISDDLTQGGRITINSLAVWQGTSGTIDNANIRGVLI